MPSWNFIFDYGMGLALNEESIKSMISLLLGCVS
jgi:hypothetical protein